MNPTIEQNSTYVDLFDYLNKGAFNGELKRAMLVFSRNTRSLGGYFSPDKWENENGERAHEIGVNANVIAENDAVEITQIILHEMVHMWQWDHGTRPRMGYHDKQFAEKCREVGLEPVAPDGRDVGQKISTSVIDGGLAEKLIIEMPANLIFTWATAQLDLTDGDGDGGGGDGSGDGSGGDGDGDGKGDDGKGGDKPSKPRSGVRAKYTCPVCGLNAWAKAGAKLICGECSQLLIESE